MTDRPDDADKAPERARELDLRSILDHGERQRGVRAAASAREIEKEDTRPAPEDEVVPPYVPPVREGSPEWERRERQEPEPPPQRPQREEKLPPVWPGDEQQPWFRRERGLPPLPGQDGTPRVDPEELPTELAEFPTRGRAFGLSVLLPMVLPMLWPPLGFIVSPFFIVANLVLFRQGQDVGAAIFRMRVVRDNGDVAGFLHMFVRSAASLVSLLLFGAGFFAAFSDPQRRTWHDKWMGTYVVKDSPEYRDRKRSSSDQAFSWFWIIVLLTVAAVIVVWLSLPPIETTNPPAE